LQTDVDRINIRLFWWWRSDTKYLVQTATFCGSWMNEHLSPRLHWPRNYKITGLYNGDTKFMSDVF